MSERYENLHSWQQSGRRNAARDRATFASIKAEYGEYEGSRLDGVVRQMRQRARTARRYSAWLLATLIFTIVLGLGYYVGLPIWQKLEDSSKRSYETVARLKADELAQMDAVRNDAWNELVSAQSRVVSRISLPDPVRDGFFGEAMTFQQGGKLVLFGASGSGWITTSAAEDWTQFSYPDNAEELIPYRKGDTDEILAFIPAGERVDENADAVIVKIDRSAFLTLYDALSHGPVFVESRPFKWPPFHSAVAADTWTRSTVPETVGAWSFQSLFEFSADSTLVALSDAGLLTSGDWGKSWKASKAFDDSEKIVSVSLHESAYIILTTRGEIHISNDRGTTWQSLPAPSEQVLRSVSVETLIAPDGESVRTIAAYLAPDDELFTRDKGITWVSREDLFEGRHSGDGDGDGDGYEEPVVEPVVVEEETFEDTVEAVVEFDGTTYEFAPDGSVFVTPNGTVERMFHTNVDNLGFFEDFSDSLGPDSGGIVLSYDGFSFGAFLATDDQGETWRSVPWATEVSDWEYLNGIIATSLTRDAVFFWADDHAGNFGLRVDDRFRQQLATVTPDAGEAGDQKLREALALLPASLQNDDTFKNVEAALWDTIAGRSALLAELAEAERNAEQIAGSGYSPAQQRQEFEQFLTVCRTDDESVQTCTNAYIELRKSSAPQVWKTLAERGPQAMLLLFLLATLGALYRYNLRLAGFHHSRADALELLDEAGGFDADTLGRVSDSLAADKVPFGRANTPADQVTEIAKAVVSRK